MSTESTRGGARGTVKSYDGGRLRYTDCALVYTLRRVQTPVLILIQLIDCVPCARHNLDHTHAWFHETGADSRGGWLVSQKRSARIEPLNIMLRGATECVTRADRLSGAALSCAALRLVVGALKSSGRRHTAGAALSGSHFSLDMLEC